MTRTLYAIIAAAAATSPSWVWAQNAPDPDRYWYGHPMMWGGGWYGMIFGPIFMILVFVAVVVVVFLVARWFGGPWHPAALPQHGSGRAPLEILKERFARGEIDKAEFEERRSVLGE